MKAIIFDLDGTLIDSAPDLREAANAALGAIGRSPLDLATVTSFIGNGVQVLVQRVLEATGGADETLRRQTLEAFLAFYAENSTTLTRPYPGVVEALSSSKTRGLHLGICTNKPTQPALSICDALGLARYFDVIVGAGDDMPRKPDPAPLLACIERMGQRPENAVYVGDSGVDYRTARNAGVTFRLYTGGYLNEPLDDLGDDSRFNDWTALGKLLD